MAAMLVPAAGGRPQLSTELLEHPFDTAAEVGGLRCTRRSYSVLYDLASEVTLPHFFNSLLVTKDQPCVHGVGTTQCECQEARKPFQFQECKCGPCWFQNFLQSSWERSGLLCSKAGNQVEGLHNANSRVVSRASSCLVYLFNMYFLVYK